MGGTYGLGGHNPLASGQDVGWLMRIPGILLLPRPAVTAIVFKAALYSLAQALSGLGGIGHADGGIASPTARDRLRDGTAAGGFHGLHHLQD